MRKKIKVLLADDTLIAREGWKRILETEDDIDIVGEAETAAESVRKARELKPDILLMDLDWFGDPTAGWSAIFEIKQEHSLKIRIIAMTAYENLIKEARRAGADSAFVKMFTRDQLLGEIRNQASRAGGKIDISEFLSKDDQITERELQVLTLLAEGHSDKEIAKLLTIAPTTAKNHVKNILGKLNAKNRTQAVTIAREKNLLK